jgi:hypothetical protein
LITVLHTPKYRLTVGVPGPGDIIIPSGLTSLISLTDFSSFLITVGLDPSLPIICATL